MNSPDISKLKSKLSLRLFFGNFTVVLMTAAIWLALSQFTELSPNWSLIASIAGGALLSLLIAILERELIFKPVLLLQQAILHISNRSQNVPAPDTTKSFFAKDFYKDMVAQIYEIAAMSKHVTSDIHRQMDLLRAVLDGMPIAIIGLSKDNKLLFANSVAQGYMSTEYKLALNNDFTKIFTLEFSTDDTYFDWINNSRSKDIKANGQWQRVSLFKNDNTKRVVDLVASYNKQESHGLETIMAIIDRTKTYMADQAEMDFVAVAAHELRGPITVIRGYLDILDEESRNFMSVDQLNTLQRVVVSAEQLSGYVNNILSVARLDQDTMKLQIRKENWEDIVRQAYDELSIRATAHGRSLKLNIESGLPEVAVDRVTITEVINNLIDNAIKYSKDGGEIRLGVAMNNGLVQTSVEDFGIGIPESVVGNLFDKFYRSHRSRTAVGGTGLGLYLSKAIVEAHNGHIWVRSQEGQGSTFGFDLPTYDAVADEVKNADNKDNKDIIRGSHGWIKNHSLYRR